MNKKIRIACFGVGGIGRRHRTLLAARTDVSIVSLIDVNEAALNQAILDYKTNYPNEPLPITGSDALKAAQEIECDYALVIIPNPYRIPVITTLLERGIPVLMEKPAAHTWADYEKMRAAQKKTGAKCMVAQDYRFKSRARVIYNLIEAGEIGDLLTIHGRFQRNYNVAHSFYGKLPGAIPFRIEMAIHHCDLALFWTKSEPTSIISSGIRNAGSWGIGETGCDIFAKFKNGCRLNYHGDWGASSDQTSFDGHWVINGTKGTLQWQDGPVILQRKYIPQQEALSGEASFSPLECESTAKVHEEFINALRENREPESSLEENGRTLKFCLDAAAQ